MTENDQPRPAEEPDKKSNKAIFVAAALSAFAVPVPRITSNADGDVEEAVDLLEKVRSFVGEVFGDTPDSWEVEES
jgi:hypothetical protein